MASVLEFEPRRISAAEYHKMIDVGIFAEDERIDLHLTQGANIRARRSWS